MNREDIIRMAREVDMDYLQYSKAERFQTWTHDYMMQRLMELVEAEREACAKLCDDHCGWTPRMIGSTIRARGQA